jgi:hypothetical protein
MNLRERILRDEAMALYVGCSLEVMKGLEVWSDKRRTGTDHYRSVHVWFTVRTGASNRNYLIAYCETYRKCHVFFKDTKLKKSKISSKKLSK